jgi:flagellar hook protein FlgE
MKTLPIATSGLSAASAALEVTAHNVANVRTPNFTPQEAASEDVANGGVRVTISQEARAASEGGATSGTDLIQETGRRSGAIAAYRANLKTIEATDETSAALLQLGGAKP